MLDDQELEVQLSAHSSVQVGDDTYRRGSEGLIIRLTAANLRVCFAFP
jgi:hypothetical protein